MNHSNVPLNDVTAAQRVALLVLLWLHSPTSVVSSSPGCRRRRWTSGSRGSRGSCPCRRSARQSPEGQCPREPHAQRVSRRQSANPTCTLFIVRSSPPYDLRTYYSDNSKTIAHPPPTPKLCSRLIARGTRHSLFAAALAKCVSLRGSRCVRVVQVRSDATRHRRR